MGLQDRQQRDIISAVAGAIAHFAFGEDANPDVFKWIESLPSRNNDGSGAKEFFTQVLSDLEQGRAHLYPFITSFEFREFLRAEADSGSSETPAQQAQHRITALIASEKRRLENPLPTIREAARVILKRRSGAEAVMQRRAPRIQLAIKQLRSDSERGIATSCKKPMRPTIAEMRADHAKREAEYQAGRYDSQVALRRRAKEHDERLEEHPRTSGIKLPPSLDDDWAFLGAASPPALDEALNEALDNSEAALERRATIHGNRLENLLTLASDDTIDNSGYELGLGIPAQWGRGRRSRKGWYIP